MDEDREEDIKNLLIKHSDLLSKLSDLESREVNKNLIEDIMKRYEKSMRILADS